MLYPEYSTTVEGVDAVQAVGVQLGPSSAMGAVRRLQIVQTAGDLEGFTYRVYNSPDAFDGNALSATHKKYRVGPLVEVPAGQPEAADAAVFNLCWPYAIRVGVLDWDQTKLYIHLTPLGTDTGKSFDINLCVETGR